MEKINIGDQLGSILDGLQGVLSSKSVVGEPSKFGDTIIIPLVDISFGLGAGGSNQESKSSGGGGGSAKVSPIAVLVINGSNVQLVNVKESDGINKLIDMVPGILSKFNFDKSDNVDQDLKSFEE